MTGKKGIWLLVLLLLLPAIVCGEEAGLHSWTKEEGWFYVYYGNYPQWLEGGTPETDAWTWSRNRLKEDELPAVEPSPILWRVLETDGETALLLSEYVLCTHPMHTPQSEYRTIGGNFAATDLAEFLRDSFLPAAFTLREAEALLAEEDTGLKVSLPSSAYISSKEYGMGTKKTRKAWATEYAIRATGTFVYQPKGGQHSPYWMKEQAKSAKHAARTTKVDGSVGYIGAESDDIGVRPVIRLDLSKTAVLSGSGTREDPCSLGAAEAADSPQETADPPAAAEGGADRAD